MHTQLEGYQSGCGPQQTGHTHLRLNYVYPEPVHEQFLEQSHAHPELSHTPSELTHAPSGRSLQQVEVLYQARGRQVQQLTQQLAQVGEEGERHVRILRHEKVWRCPSSQPVLPSPCSPTFPPPSLIAGGTGEGAAAAEVRGRGGEEGKRGSGAAGG